MKQPPIETPEDRVALIRRRAEILLQLAQTMGVTLRIDLEPIPGLPLSAPNHRPVIQAWTAHPKTRFWSPESFG